MKPDIIVCWPTNCDYPLWRKFIRSARADFNGVFIVMTKANQDFDYTSFVKVEMGKLGCIVTESPRIGPGMDWRNVAVNHALRLSRSGWVWFTEQDFYPRVEMWDEVRWALSQKTGVCAVYEGDRMHPCCIFASKIVINSTGKNFGVVEGELDHFGLFQKDLGKHAVCHIPPDTYEHLAGVSHNFRLISSGEEPNYKPERFRQYINACLDCGEPLSAEFVKICLTYLKRK